MDRGKTSGHDLDVLFSYPNEEGGESHLLATLLSQLETRGFVLWSRLTHDVKQGAEINKHDKLMLLMMILKFPLDGNMDQDLKDQKDMIRTSTASHQGSYDHFQFIFVCSTEDLKDLMKLEAEPRKWRAVRVDLLTAKWSQWPTALLGWTGNKQYNRALRLHAKGMDYSLSNTALFDMKRVLFNF